MLIPLALTLRFGIETQREKQGWSRLVKRNVWPAALPIKDRHGTYTPSEASDAVAKVQETVKENLLSPAEGKILSCEAVTTPSLGAYWIEGSVESVNQYGTRVVAQFKAIAHRPYRVTRRPPPQPPEWKRQTDEWRVVITEAEVHQNSTIWREGNLPRVPRPMGPARGKRGRGY